MRRNAAVTLDDHSLDFVENQVASGRFDSKADVVRAGLRLLEEHEQKVQALNDALIEGEESGPSQLFDRDAFFARMHASIRSDH